MQNMTKGGDKYFWTSKEAANYLSVNVWTLLAWCSGKKGAQSSKLIGPKPPFRRFGRNCIRFPIEAFREWADTSNPQRRR